MGFIAGCFVGGFVILLAVGLCCASRQADDEEKESMNKQDDENIEGLL